MIYVTDTLRINFHHNIVQGEKTPYGNTLCYIQELRTQHQFDVEDGEWVDIAVGLARCSKGDMFSRTVGRKLAFTRAVSGVYSREKRKILWNAFRAGVKQ